MGNKIEKSSFDQNLLDKLVEETGLEREVIIAWRFVIELLFKLSKKKNILLVFF
jgi:hypothetical protein